MNNPLMHLSFKRNHYNLIDIGNKTGSTARSIQSQGSVQSDLDRNSNPRPQPQAPL